MLFSDKVLKIGVSLRSVLSLKLWLQNCDHNCKHCICLGTELVSFKHNVLLRRMIAFNVDIQGLMIVMCCFQQNLGYVCINDSAKTRLR